jgi:hypothetical protein
MPVHHIIPKHMGGTNDPSNLFECTLEEHANLHLALYLEHGKTEDWIASQAISGIMKNEEVIHQVLVLAGSKKCSDETKQKMSESGKRAWKTRKWNPDHHVPSTKGYTHTDEARKKMSDAAKRRWRNASK